jgi:hypothetical protein
MTTREGITVDNTIDAGRLADVTGQIAALLGELVQTPAMTLASAEQIVQQQMRALAREVLEAGLQLRGTGKAEARLSCPCGATAGCEGYRPKSVQTAVGWIEVRRAYYVCGHCGQSQVPLDAQLGLARDSHSSTVRQQAARLGALVSYAQASETLADLTGIQLSPSTVRRLTLQAGARQQAAVDAEIDMVWQLGLPLPGVGPARLYVALDGVYVLGCDGAGIEAKVGVIQPEADRPTARERLPASYVADFGGAAHFGQRVWLEVERRGARSAAEVVVLGDGAAWIWNLAAEHFPQATQILDWYHASERVWTLGRALFGESTAETSAWVQAQLRRLAAGGVTELVADWQALACHGPASLVRDEQVTYFTNQASRMAYDQYRARGFAIGSGMVESACKRVIGARHKGAGMRWSERGAQAVANVRVLLLNQQWEHFWHEAA